MDQRTRILEAADRLFYAHGISRVGMDAVRDEAGASLKAIYREFPSKEHLVIAVLDHRHRLWTEGVEQATSGTSEPRERILALYDYLADWFAEEGFRGCGFINAFAELGADSPQIAEAVRQHKESFQQSVDALVAEMGAPSELGAQLAILAEGAQTTAAIAGTPDAALSARSAAEVLINAALPETASSR